jgi:mono/diheme cytochrome c family protein
MPRARSGEVATDDVVPTAYRVRWNVDANKDGKAGEDADLHLVIKNGAGAYGGNPAMAPWGHLGDKDIDDLIAYIRTLKK